MTEVKKEESKFKGLFGKKDPAATPAVDQEKFDNIDRQTEDWRSKQAKGYQEHSHCTACGRAVHIGKKYCSMECKGKIDGVQKKQGKQQKMMCLVMGAVMPIMLIVMFMFQG